MTYLELCQKLRQRVGIAGTGPATVINQAGELARLVNWVADAYIDIQTSHQDWDWMRASASFTTVAGQAIYPLGSGSGTCEVTEAVLGLWDDLTFRNYDTASGVTSEMFMSSISYDEWRDSYSFGAQRSTQTRPTIAAVSPAKGICLGPYPANGYTVTADYFIAPVTLVNDSDIPAMPVQFHNMIMYKAMMYYGSYESAPEVYEEGSVEFAKAMNRLRKDSKPQFRFAGALA